MKSSGRVTTNKQRKLKRRTDELVRAAGQLGAVFIETKLGSGEFSPALPLELFEPPPVNPALRLPMPLQLPVTCIRCDSPPVVCSVGSQAHYCQFHAERLWRGI